MESPARIHLTPPHDSASPWRGWRRRLVFAAGCLLFFLGVSPSGFGQAIDAQVQERLAQLVQDALWPSGPDPLPTNATTTPAPDRAVVVEKMFREASALAPERLDLRFGIASTLLGQATQTNVVFEAKLQEVLATYEDIAALDPHGFMAPLLHVAYSLGVGGNEASAGMARALQRYHPERADEYLRKFQRLEEILQQPPPEEPSPTMPPTACHAIIILGAGLEAGGVMKPKLIERLQRGLWLALLYPQAPVLVTGGNAREGQTESYAMSGWLQRQGIPRERVWIEDQARDTVGNALLSCRLLEKHGITHATLVSSASHLQRSLALFEEAAAQRGLAITFATFAAPDRPDTDANRSRLAIYRDVLRTSGLWLYPGMQR